MKPITASVLLSLALAAASTTAEAANTTFANRAKSAVGTTVSTVGPSLGFFSYNFVQGRSYHAYGFIQYGLDANAGQCQVRLLDSLGAPTADLGGDEEPQDPGSDGDGLIAPASGEYVVEVTPTAGTTCQLVVTETTLFSPWFFRDPAQGYDGFVEVKNTTRTAVAATITAYAANGTVIGATTQTVPANGTTLATVSQLGATSAGYGSVQIAHVGKAGAILANLTTLSGATGLSFDAPFASRPQTPRH